MLSGFRVWGVAFGRLKALTGYIWVLDRNI